MMVKYFSIGLYSVGRFFIEGLRTDSLMSGSFRIVRLASLAGVLLNAVVEFIILLVSFALVKGK